LVIGSIVIHSPHFIRANS